MVYPITNFNDNNLRKLYIYQTRVGLAPKFGSRPIAWYQYSQHSVYDLIIKKMKEYGMEKANIKTKFGFVFANGITIGSINYFYSQANK